LALFLDFRTPLTLIYHNICVVLCALILWFPFPYSEWAYICLALFACSYLWKWLHCYWKVRLWNIIKNRNNMFLLLETLKKFISSLLLVKSSDSKTQLFVTKSILSFLNWWSVWNNHRYELSMNQLKLMHPLLKCV